MSCSHCLTRSWQLAACSNRILAAAKWTRAGAKIYLGVIGVLEARNLLTKGPNLPQDSLLYHVSKAKPKGKQTYLVKRHGFSHILILLFALEGAVKMLPKSNSGSSQGSGGNSAGGGKAGKQVA